MARINKIAAVTIPSTDYFAKVARGIIAGASTVSAAVTQAETLVLTARVNSLTVLRDALVGCPAVTPELWKASWAEGLGGALIASGTYTDKSVRVILSQYKAAIMALTNGHAVLPGETLHTYLVRLGLKKANASNVKKDGGKEGATGNGTAGQRAPQLPTASAAQDIEADFEYACLLVADDDEKRAKVVNAIFSDAAGIEAFDAFAAAYFAAKVEKKARGFRRA